MRPLALAPLASFALACSSATAPPSAAPDASSTAADAGGVVDKSSTCAAQFGQAIGSVGFARFDGTVVAVVPPGNLACAEPNSTHLVVQMQTGGAVYRMVVDVDDTSARGSIHATTASHPLVGPAWSDGWHATTLDYATDLGARASGFATDTTTQAVATITTALDLGARVSIYATAAGEADSAHLVHRNGARNDGAIVVDPDGASPTWYLFAFKDQAF